MPSSQISISFSEEFHTNENRSYVEENRFILMKINFIIDLVLKKINFIEVKNYFKFYIIKAFLKPINYIEGVW